MKEKIAYLKISQTTRVFSSSQATYVQALHPLLRDFFFAKRTLFPRVDCLCRCATRGKRRKEEEGDGLGRTEKREREKQILWEEEEEEWQSVKMIKMKRERLTITK